MLQDISPGWRLSAFYTRRQRFGVIAAKGAECSSQETGWLVQRISKPSSADVLVRHSCFVQLFEGVPALQRKAVNEIPRQYTRLLLLRGSGEAPVQAPCTSTLKKHPVQEVQEPCISRHPKHTCPRIRSQIPLQDRAHLPQVPSVVHTRIQDLRGAVARRPQQRDSAVAPKLLLRLRWRRQQAAVGIRLHQL